MTAKKKGNQGGKADSQSSLPPYSPHRVWNSKFNVRLGEILGSLNLARNELYELLNGHIPAAIEAEEPHLLDRLLVIALLLGDQLSVTSALRHSTLDERLRRKKGRPGFLDWDLFI